MPILPPPPPSPPPPLLPSAGPFGRWLAHPGTLEHHAWHQLTRGLAALATGWWPLLVGLGAAALVAIAATAAVSSARRSGGRWVAIAPPAEPDPAGGLALWRMLTPLLAARSRLLGRRPPVAFEAHADAAGLRLGLWVSPTLSASGVARTVEIAWPGSAATVTTPPRLPERCQLAGGRARLAGPDWLPLGVDPAGGDQIRGLLAALLPTHTEPSSGVALVQVLARPAPHRRVARATRAARAPRRGQPAARFGPGLGLFRGQRHRPPGPADPVAAGQGRDIAAKAAGGPHFEAAVRYAATGGTTGDDRRVRPAQLRQLAAGLGLYTGRNRLVARRLHRPRTVITRRRLRHGFLLSAAELAALAHLPASPAGYGLPAPPARTVAPPPEVPHA